MDMEELLSFSRQQHNSSAPETKLLHSQMKVVWEPSAEFLIKALTRKSKDLPTGILKPHLIYSALGRVHRAIFVP